jgi:nitroreductase
MTPTEDIDINHLIEKRWSPRAFEDKPVQKNQLLSMFEAARWAPSSMNEQPWRFIYATKDGKEAYERLFNCLVEGNQVWAKNAPVLFLSVAKKDYEKSGKPNSHAWHDVGMATANLVIQATSLGLHAHLMGGFSAQKAQETLSIPEEYEPVTMGAIGYVGEPEMLPDNLQERELAERNRKPLTDIAFNGKWDERK